MRPCWCREHGPERPRSREWRRSDLCAKRPDQPWPTLRASAAAVPPEHWFTRASDASPWRLGLPALAGCGSWPRSVGLRCCPSQLPSQTGRSDLCSRHQHGSTGHSSCCVIRVTQLSRISQFLPQIGSGRWAGGSRPLILGRCIDPVGAGPYRTGVVSVAATCVCCLLLCAVTLKSDQVVGQPRPSETGRWGNESEKCEQDEAGISLAVPLTNRVLNSTLSTAKIRCPIYAQ